MRKPIFFAILAAALYALNSPFSKLLLQNVPPTMIAGFLYLGAGVGMALMGFVRQHTQKEIRETRLQKYDLPYTVAMIALDIAAPVFLMIPRTTSKSSSGATATRSTSAGR